MTTEQYSIGYDEGYQAGWNAAMDAKPAQPQQEPVAWGNEPWMSGYGVRVGRDTADCIDLIFTKVYGQEFQLYANEAAYLRDLLNKADIPGYTSPPAQQEPVARVHQLWPDPCRATVVLLRGVTVGDLLYTSPPVSKPWVGLTEQEHTDIAIQCGCMSADWVFYGATVERILKEKNS